MASSGAVSLDRPDRLRANRANGFVDFELLFDGTTLTLLGRNAGRYTQVEAPGTTDHLLDELRDTHGRPMPAADLLTSNTYDALMHTVTDVKDLGSGMIGGVECDWLAFRTDEVDWQIRIAQGEQPYPCRYVITTSEMAHSPQYTIQVRDWATGDAVPVDDFAFAAPDGATEIGIDELRKLAATCRRTSPRRATNEHPQAHGGRRPGTHPRHRHAGARVAARDPRRRRLRHPGRRGRR